MYFPAAEYMQFKKKKKLGPCLKSPGQPMSIPLILACEWIETGSIQFRARLARHAIGQVPLTLR